MTKTWKLSSFDTFCLGMNIKSAWIYRETPDFEKMKSALKSIASMYPHLDGRYDEKTKSVIWDDSSNPILPFDSIDLTKYSISDVSGNAKKAWSLVRPYDVKGYKNGLVPAFSATLGYLKDGCILFVQCAHATMDAHSFYALIGQWAAAYKGEELTAMRVDQSLVPSDKSYSKEETLRLVQQKGWPQMGFGKLVKMLVGLVRNNSIKYTTTIEISQEEISRIKAESGAGTNAVLSAIVLKRIAQRLPDKKSFKMLFTTDLRERISGVGGDFFGNMSQPAVLDRQIPADADITATATIIGECLKEALSEGRLEETIRLHLCASNYSLPYVHFDPSDMNCPGNGTIIINSLLKFHANEIDWGDGLPVYTFTNELEDMVKLWQPVSGGPVQIIFGGYAAKLMK